MRTVYWRVAAVLLGLCGIASIASAQVPIYYLHQNASTTSGLFQTKTTSPEDPALIVQSIDLRNQPLGEYVIKEFDTPIGVPGLAGTIPSLSTLTFKLYMRKTAANWGTMTPVARVRLNNGSGRFCAGRRPAACLGRLFLSSPSRARPTATSS